jgi:putative endopeptidase
MKKKIFYFMLFAIFILTSSCSSRSKNEATFPDPLVSHIDSTIKPGDDFFLFANGKWFKENPIPASEQSNGLWNLIRDTINEQVRHICELSSKITDAKEGSSKQKIGDFFFTGMDSVSLAKKGMTDLKNDMDMIDHIKDIKELLRAAAYFHLVSGAPLFNFWVTQDDKISSKNAIFIGQGGLSLPDRSYYFDTDLRAKVIRKEFTEHLYRMFTLIGYDDTKAKTAADRMVVLETAIAKTSKKREDTRDPLKNYYKKSFKQFTELTPNLDWTIFLGNVGLPKVDTVVVCQPEFLVALNGYLTSFPLADWKDYMKYHLVRDLAFYIDDKTYLETFRFYSTILRGVKEPRPRWKRVVQETNSSLGELVGQIYVAEYLPEGTKDKLMEIGKAIKDVYAERIKALDWMSESTKKKALQKLSTIVMKVGYPNKWKDLSSMKIDRSSYVKNAMSASKWSSEYMISKYGKPVDRSEWSMYPQTYNAYYNSSNNEIVVPGCNIIVPGYERKLADDAILYSVIGGSTFGHEITHGFDDQGSKYDDRGNLNNWWTPEDSSRFYAKTKMIVKQFNNYIAVDSLHINGELTQGENIADLAGIMMGYEAFKKTSQYKKHEMVAGLTPDQRFFLGYALAWMVNERPESVANQVRSDEHSPAKFRVVGPLANMPELYSTFGIKRGDAMWRPDSLRVKIW